MRDKWIIAGPVTLLVLALAILFGQGAGQALGAQADLLVTKSVDRPAVAPGEQVIYTVMIENTTAAAVDVPSVVDTLPDSFEYVGLAPTSDWEYPPWDSTPPVIQWGGPDGPIQVPAHDSLALSYWVHVPESTPLGPEPYTNTVVVSDSYQAEAPVVVGLGAASVAKAARPTRVASGATVTYTATFQNMGYAPLQLGKITDDLPDDVTWIAMTGDSDISAHPSTDTGTITWMGPFTIPVDDPLVLEYVTSMPETGDTLQLQNQVSGYLSSGAVVTDSAEVRVGQDTWFYVYMPFITYRFAPPHFVATKTASPVEVAPRSPGELVTYEVAIQNKGTMPGELSQIRDTLPAGFTFVQMLSGPQPSSTTSPITWQGPFQVNGESSLTLRYQVRASSTLGTYVNTVVATVSNGTPRSVSASASVVVKEPILLREEWTNPSPHWEEYLNYWRLKPQQWHIKPTGSDDGSAALAHAYYLGVSNPVDGAHDALIMYKGPGAEQWTDYEFRVRGILNSDDGSGRGQFGVWFRGTGEQEGQPPGRYVTGYYFSVQPIKSKRVMLLQMRTDDECGDDCSFNYHFSNPLLLEQVRSDDLEPLGLDLRPGRWYWLKVRVEGPRIRCYVDDVLVIDYYDNVGTTFTEGTVGFFTYIAGDARFDHVIVESLD